MALQWNSSMTTGVAELDNQHQELIRMANAFSDAMIRGIAKDQVLATIDHMMTYAAAHFAKEEACMNRHRCPAAAANKAAHAALVALLQQKRAELQTKGVTTSAVLELHKLISDWLRQHICTIDTQLTKCVSVAGAA